MESTLIDMAFDRRLERLEKKLQSLGADFDSALLDETDAREEGIADCKESCQAFAISYVGSHDEEVKRREGEAWESYAQLETRIEACEQRIESYVEHGVAGIQLEAFEERIKGEMERRMDDLIEQRLAAVYKQIEEQEKDSGHEADSQGARQRRGRRGGRQGPLARKQQEREEAGEDT